MNIHLNIGSNRGHRTALIERAVAAIAAQWPQATIARSQMIESPPWGYTSPHPFLNIGLTLTFTHPPCTPHQLLDTLDAISATISTTPHRNPDGTYRDRDLDIDIIAIDTLVITTPRLILPHPRAHLRPFVLIPLSTLAPQWRHPILHLTPAQMLQALNAENHLD